MPLEISIIDESDKVLLGVKEHWELYSKAVELGLLKIQKMKDYYEDFEISPTEINDFMSELIEVDKKEIREAGLKKKVKLLIDMALKAKKNGKGMVGIAD